MDTGGIVSVAQPGPVLILRQLLWQDARRTFSAIYGAAGSLEDGRDISAAGEPWRHRRVRAQEQWHEAGPLRGSPGVPHRTARSRTDHRGRADSETPSSHTAGSEALPCQRMGGRRDRRRPPPLGHGRPRLPATPEPGDPADVLRAAAGGSAMAVAHHASGWTVAEVCPWAYEVPMVSCGEICEGMEGLFVGVSSLWSSALPERMENCGL